MKILLVEDEQKVALFIQKGLKENGFSTEIAYDGMIGAEMATNNVYDAIILDVNLPQMNGYELCSLIRKSNSQVPIIMLTAFGTIDNKLQGFDVGANDYIVKPFEFRELLARIKNLVNRKENSSTVGNRLVVANLEMDLTSKTVYRDQKKIELTAKEYVLLEFFIRSKGRSVSRAEIAEKVWDINFDTGTNIVDVYVNFKKKIDKDFSPKLIHTQFGMGYIFKETED